MSEMSEIIEARMKSGESFSYLDLVGLPGLGAVANNNHPARAIALALLDDWTQSGRRAHH